MRALRLLLALCLSFWQAEAQQPVLAAMLLVEADAQMLPRRRTSVGGGGFSSPRRRFSSFSSPRRRTYTYVSPRRRSTVIVSPRRRSYYGGGGYYGYDGRRRGSTVIIGGGGGYYDDRYYGGGSRVYYSNGGGGGVVTLIVLIILVVVVVAVCGNGSRRYNQVDVGDNRPFIYTEQRAPDVFNFPPTPAGLSRDGVRNFVNALREEYVYGRGGAVGGFLSSGEAQDLGSEGMVAFERVEDQIRNAQPDNRMEALGNLERIWMDGVVELVAQAVPVEDFGGFPASAPPMSRFPLRPAMDQATVANFIYALRDEYQRGRPNSVGAFFEKNGAQAQPFEELLDSVENMVRQDPGSIDELEGAWRLEG